MFVNALDDLHINHIVVECAFGDSPFELSPAPHVIRRRCSSVLWQKERLLNIALEKLPLSCKKVAWIDADILFENSQWNKDCCRLLESKAVVQLFEQVVWLPNGVTKPHNEAGIIQGSFGAEYSRRPGCEHEGWENHGHTGFAWAARREVLERCGFFDVCLTGSADHLMAHGFVGDDESNCIRWMIGRDTAVRRQYSRWAAIAYSACLGKVGVVPGRAFHLWHGELQNRHYGLHSEEFRAMSFLPTRDLRLTHDGCWEWTGENPLIEVWARNLFVNRKEDG